MENRMKSVRFYQSTAFPGILINDDTQSALKELDKEKFNQESLLTIVDDQDKRQVYENMGLNCARYTLCPFYSAVYLRVRL